MQEVYEECLLKDTCEFSAFSCSAAISLGQLPNIAQKVLPVLKISSETIDSKSI